MIYLFEDRKGRMLQFLKHPIDNKYIKEGILDCEKKNAIPYLNGHYSDAKCILFHKSYTFSQTSLSADFIKQLFLKMGVPVIYFSGDLSNSLFVEQGLLIGNVNSGDMYNNLYLFVQDYKHLGKPNIPLLVYGKKYLLNSLLELQHIICMMLFDKENDCLLNKLDIDGITSAIRSRINEPELMEDKKSLIMWLEHHTYEGKLKVVDVKEYIQKIINQH